MQAHLAGDSNWLPRLFELSDWKNAEQRDERIVYFSNLLRQTHNLKAGQTLQFDLRSPAQTNR